MKRIYFLLLVISATAGLHAQTKEETLLWISGKINTYNYKDNDFFHCTAPEFPDGIFLWNYKNTCDTTGKISVIRTYSDGNFSSPTTFTADFRDLINVEIKQDDNCKKSFIYLVFKPNTVWRRDKEGNVGKDNSIELYLVWNFEDDLQNRMMKAFRHLIDLQKPKETF